MGLPPRALKALSFVIEAAALVIPQVCLTMSSVEAVPVFLMLLLLWVTVGLKIWLRLLRGTGARQQMGVVVQQLAEPRKRCALRLLAGAGLCKQQ